jgi:hypothetical protein
MVLARSSRSCSCIASFRPRDAYMGEGRSAPLFLPAISAGSFRHSRSGAGRDRNAEVGSGAQYRPAAGIGEVSRAEADPVADEFAEAGDDADRRGGNPPAMPASLRFMSDLQPDRDC